MGYIRRSLLLAAGLLGAALALRGGLFAFALPVVPLALTTRLCLQAAQRGRARRVAWWMFAGCAAFGLLGAAIGVTAALMGFHSRGAPGGAAALASALAALVGIVLLAVRNVPGIRFERLVDAVLLCGVVTALSGYLVAIPTFRDGSPVLAATFVVDLGVLVLTVLATMARGGRRWRRMGWGIVISVSTFFVTAAWTALGSAGHPDPSNLFIASMWTVSSFGAMLAASNEVGEEAEPDVTPDGWRWIVARLVLPLAAVLAFPAFLVVVAAHDGSVATWKAAYFGGFFVVALLLLFGRQAYVLVANRRAMRRERALREQVMRRNDELRALTGLATTMTQTLEEKEILERSLDVLRVGFRASTVALHLWSGDELELEATSGVWHEDAALVGTPEDDRDRTEPPVLRVPVQAREAAIGVVTLVRHEEEPDEDQVILLRLLAGQLGIALQNARDYREKLEQAIRDPLTGSYNRRFFFEALEKEVSRSRRYGNPLSLVIFDLDDFKQVNDTLGHGAGDRVLRAVAQTVEDQIRPADSFARIGGEEFGLLLPETEQLDALLTAERIRRSVASARILPDRTVTMSGGVSSCPDDAGTKEALERKADAALYWAKHNGKNLCAVASEVVVGDGGDESEQRLSHLHALVAMIDAKELHTRDHSENVAAYAVAIARALGFHADRLPALRRAALLHDVGKVAISSAILEKPAALTDAEYAEIRLHAPVGASMLAHSGLHEEARWVRHHHERIDGRGYPDCLGGDEIPIEARIIFVADSFEAMTSDRPYRSGMPVEEAVEELRRCAGTQFDAAAVDALAGLVEGGELRVEALRS